MIILDKPISVEELKVVADELFGDMVKAVADVRNGLIAIDAELHSNLERLLLENGSNQGENYGDSL